MTAVRCWLVQSDVDSEVRLLSEDVTGGAAEFCASVFPPIIIGEQQDLSVY